MTITLGSSCDSPGMSAMPGAFIFGRLSRKGAEFTQRRKDNSLVSLRSLRELCAFA
jgi:hypothetical protein